ncbi:MAG TPA: sigma-70 family RNA polymerase sigma factor [Syntrophomonadaceae bacterium]|nr:sigma-70 family RNA polymerase sigma factor [Syntrophomonadaceae bacterium]
MVPVNVDKVSKACNGDNNAFSDLIQERKADIYKMAYTYMKNQEDALDVVHDVVYKALISMKKLKNPEFYNTWLTRITVNCCINNIKKRKKLARFKEEQGYAEELEQISDCSQDNGDLISSTDLFNAIDKLNVEQRTVVVLKYYQDLTLTQIADILVCPLSTVKTRLNKALSLLRMELKAGYNESLSR